MKSLHSRPHRQADTHSITHHKNDLATRTRQRKRHPLRGPSRSPNCSLPFRMQHRVIQQRPWTRYDGMEFTPLSPRSSFQLLLCTPSCPERPQSLLRRLSGSKTATRERRASGHDENTVGKPGISDATPAGGGVHTLPPATCLHHSQEGASSSRRAEQSSMDDD